MPQQSAQFYYNLIKDVVYEKFPPKSISDFPYNCSLFVNGKVYFGDLCHSVLIYFDGKKLYWPHHLGIATNNLPPYNRIIEPFTEDNQPTKTLDKFICDYTPTYSQIVEICDNMLKEINRVKEDYKIELLNEDFK